MPDTKALTKEQAQTQVKEAKAEKGRLQKLIDEQIDKQIAKLNLPSWAVDIAKEKAKPYIAQFNEQIAKLDQKINELEEAIKKYTGLTDIVRPIEKLVKGDYAGGAVDVLSQYAEKYGNMKKEFFKVNYSKNFPTSIPGLSINAGFGASLAASLTTKAGAGASSITSTGKVDCKANFSCGITLGYDVPVVGNFSVTGGIRGDATLTGNISATLSGKNTVLSGTLSGKLNVNVGAELFLKTPSLIQKWPIECKPEYTYPLGRIDLLTGTIPTYSIDFDMAKGAFTQKSKSGEFSLKLHDKVQAKINEAKQTVSDLIAKANPSNWF
jgi:hypothetical protein